MGVPVGTREHNSQRTMDSAPRRAHDAFFPRMARAQHARSPRASVIGRIGERRVSWAGFTLAAVMVCASGWANGGRASAASPAPSGPVTVGITDGKMIQVLTGLRAGEKVITKGSLFIDREATGS